MQIVSLLILSRLQLKEARLVFAENTSQTPALTGLSSPNAAKIRAGSRASPTRHTYLLFDVGELRHDGESHDHAGA